MNREAEKVIGNFLENYDVLDVSEIFDFNELVIKWDKAFAHLKPVVEIQIKLVIGKINDLDDLLKKRGNTPCDLKWIFEDQIKNIIVYGMGSINDWNELLSLKKKIPEEFEYVVEDVKMREFLENNISSINDMDVLDQMLEDVPPELELIIELQMVKGLGGEISSYKDIRELEMMWDNSLDCLDSIIEDQIMILLDELKEPSEWFLEACRELYKSNGKKEDCVYYALLAKIIEKAKEFQAQLSD